MVVVYFANCVPLVFCLFGLFGVLLGGCLLLGFLVLVIYSWFTFDFRTDAVSFVFFVVRDLTCCIALCLWLVFNSSDC